MIAIQVFYCDRTKMPLLRLCDAKILNPSNPLKIMYKPVSVSTVLEKVAQALGNDEIVVYNNSYFFHIRVHDKLVDVLTKQIGSDSTIIETVPLYVRQLLLYNNSLRPRSIDKNGDDIITIGKLVGDKLWETLYPFQKTGVQFIIRRGGRGMIADDQGLGKMLQGIAIMSYYMSCNISDNTTKKDNITDSCGVSILVICPNCVTNTWYSTIKDYMPSSEPTIIENWKSTINRQGINILSFGMMASKKFAPVLQTLGPLTVVVVDESHYVKNREAVRSKATMRLCKSAERVVLLSGTPLNRPVDLYSQLKCIHPRLFPSFFHFDKRKPAHSLVTNPALPEATFTFAGRYCNPEYKLVRGRYVFLFKGSSNESELYALLKQFYMIRRTKKQVLKDLPLKIREKIVLANNRSSPFSISEKKNFKSDAEFMKMVRETSLLKLPLAKTYLKDIVIEELANQPDLKIIIWAHHHFVIEELKEMFQEFNDCFTTVVMDGRVKGDKRYQLVNQFQTDPAVRVAILGIHAMKTGVTLTAATLEIIVELAFSPQDLEQCEDRCHRIGQQHPVTIRYLLYENTIDDVVWNIIQSKNRTAGKVIDNRPKFWNISSTTSATDRKRKARQEEKNDDSDIKEEQQTTKKPKKTKVN